jgi:integrase
MDRPIRPFSSNSIGLFTVAWAKKNKIDFRPFRFHDLRHLHAGNWLKELCSIYLLRAL